MSDKPQNDAADSGVRAGRPPRDDLVRATSGDYELRSSESGTPKLVGHFAVFNTWAEIDSLFEGHFMECIAPGAFSKTIAESGERMKVLFNHGSDPSIGNKVLGPIVALGEDELGAAYEVDLLDTSYNKELSPGLRAGLYGSSFRFAVMHEDYNARPGKSEHNPKGLPERTLLEIKVKEFGPVTFPAYSEATAGARSLTDELVVARFAERPDRLAQLLDKTGIRSERSRDELRAERRYERCVEYVGDTPWAMYPPALATILQVLGERSSGYRPSAEEIAERIGLRDVTAGEAPPAVPAVAVIDISGPIVPHGAAFQDTSSGQLAGVDGLSALFRQALENSDVKAIVFNIDSPGGAVDLVPEFASEILAARGEKPIVAVANTFAGSAAYWIACAADELIVPPSGKVGSVGVWSAHEDVSVMQEMKGVKTTLVSAAPYKVELNPFEPLGEEAQAEMQRKVDAYYQMFVDAVAQGRGVKSSQVKSDFGQGRMVMAKDAVAAGMADRVGTLRQTLARLEKQGGSSPRAASAVDDEPEPHGATTHQAPEPEPHGATTHERPNQLYGQGSGRKEKRLWTKTDR